MSQSARVWSRDPSRFRWFDALPGVGFLCLYLLTLSRTLSLTHDSAAYLERIGDLQPAMLANHLWFEPFMSLVFSALKSIRPLTTPQEAIESVNAVAGGAAMQAYYLLAARRLALPRASAFLATTCAGFTYAVWYYSTAIEAYMLPLALCLWIVFALSDPERRWSTILCAAVAHGFAVLLHQGAILLAPVCAAALLATGDGGLRRRRHAMCYGTLLVLLVGAAYLGAASSRHDGTGARHTAAWMMGHLSEDRFWSRPPRSIAEAAVGYGRAAIGGQVAFRFPVVVEWVRRLFPARNFVDEAFFVRSLTANQAAALAVGSAVSLLALATLVAGSVWLLLRRRTHVPLALGLLWGWWSLSCAFFLFWDPANPDFWIVQVSLTPLLAMATFAWAYGHAPARWPFVLLASTLLLVTGCGTVRLARSVGNDYYTVYLRSVDRETRIGDVLLLGDQWPLRTHLRLHKPLTAIFLSMEFTKTSPDDLARRLAHARDSGKRVFVTSEALLVQPSTQSSYGPGYLRFAREVRARLCGFSPPRGGPDEMVLREVTCISSSSSNDRGQSSPSSLDSARSASSRPPV